MPIDFRRVGALLWKDWLELRGTLAPWLPGLLVIPAVGLPFFLTILLPAIANEPLEDSEFAEQIEKVKTFWPVLRTLSPAAAVQALVFQQFLALLLLVPVSGAMSIAAHSIIGEKQGRTLEPLLATPLTPLELLLAKVLAALGPALILEAVAVVLYFGGIALLARPGVAEVMISIRTGLLVGLIGPLAALVALQLVVLMSSRAKDPRSAQQIGVLVVIPIVGLMISQGVGAFWLTVPATLAASAFLLLAWLALLGLSAALFSQEQVLTRWR